MDVQSKTKLKTETRSWGGETVSLEFVIDDAGLILKSKDPLTGKWFDYRYDGLGRITQISFPINGTATPIISDIQYSPSNLILGYSLPPSNISATRRYSPQNDRLVSIAYTSPTYVTYKDWESAERNNQVNRLDLPEYRQDPIVTGNSLLYFSQTYQYDPAGNRIQMTHNEHNDTFNFTYEYDKLNALIGYSGSINGSDPITQRYTYDPQGNRTSLSQPGINMTIAYQSNANLPTTLWFGQSRDSNFAEFTHDKNGNRLSKSVKSNANDILGQATYSWDARNRMTNYQLNNSLQTTNKYQFSGPRYEKKDTVAGKSTTTRYYVDAGHRLLSEKVIDDSGVKEYSYVYPRG